MNPVIHFEMPAEDRRRMAEFYTKVFGWETNQLGPEMNNYIVVMTAKSDDKGPLERCRINGGFYEETPEMGEQHPSVVIEVENVEAHLEKIKEAGGTPLGEPMDIPGVGRYAIFRDTEGNQVSIIKSIS